MPLSTRRVERRLAPATDAAIEYAQTTKVTRRTKVPRAGIPLGPGPAHGRGLVLRRALRHDPVGFDEEAVAVEASLDHDLGAVLEGVRHDPGVAGVDDLAFTLHLEGVFERVRLPHDRFLDHEAVELELLALPRRGVNHDLLHVFVVLRALGKRRIHQATQRPYQDSHRGHDSDRFRFHLITRWSLEMNDLLYFTQQPMDRMQGQ